MHKDLILPFSFEWTLFTFIHFDWKNNRGINVIKWRILISMNTFHSFTSTERITEEWITSKTENTQTLTK